MSDFAKIQCHNVQKMTKIIPKTRSEGILGRYRSAGCYKLPKVVWHNATNKHLPQW